MENDQAVRSGLSARAALVLLSGIALLSVASCRDLPVAPSLSPVTGDGAEPPAVQSVRIARHGDAIGFELSLSNDVAAGRLPLDTPSRTGASWAFQLALDTDQRGETGRHGGVDYELILMPDGELAVYRQSDIGSIQVASVAVSVQPGRVSFSVPAAVLGDDDGWMDYVLRTYRAEIRGGAHDYVLAATIAGTNQELPDESLQVPAIINVRTEVRGDTLYLRAQFLARDPLYRTSYDPEEPGGWSLQLFLNTDQAPTGYWRGYDYIVQGSEVRPDGSFVTRWIAPDESGWGPMTGTSRFTLHPRTFEIAVPLAAIGDDDGLLDYCLEQYAAVDCPDCPGGFTAHYVSDFFGSVGSNQASRLVVHGRLRPGDTLLHGGGVHPLGRAMDGRVATAERPGRD